MTKKGVSAKQILQAVDLKIEKAAEREVNLRREIAGLFGRVRPSAFLERERWGQDGSAYA